jgi:3-dehydroquinate dehydratase II
VRAHNGGVRGSVSVNRQNGKIDAQWNRLKPSMMKFMTKIVVLHGPNLNLLGTREPLLYGSVGLDAVNARLKTVAIELGCQLDTFQSNAEHELIDYVQAARDDHVDFIIINPAGYSYSSLALVDALAAVAIPFIEVHVSNILGRESIRQQSLFFASAQGVICGLGSYGYEAALLAANHFLSKKPSGV